MQSIFRRPKCYVKSMSRDCNNVWYQSQNVNLSNSKKDEVVTQQKIWIMRKFVDMNSINVSYIQLKNRFHIRNMLRKIQINFKVFQINICIIFLHGLNAWRKTFRNIGKLYWVSIQTFLLKYKFHLFDFNLYALPTKSYSTNANTNMETVNTFPIICWNAHQNACPARN